MSHGIEADQNGLFGLCVFGAENSSDDEVMDNFGKFGSIVHWNRNKNLVFIRYSSLQEAIDCFEKMQSQSKFSVKPARRKGNGDKPDYQRGKNRSSDLNKGFETNYKKNDNGAVKRNSGDSEQNTRRPMPNLKFDIPQPEQLKADTSSDAQEYHRVIVAHLHPYMKQSDVYDLCHRAKAQPAHVDMKSFCRPPYATEYYAIVYVKSHDEVWEIVKGLNNLKINGYQLVVAHYDKLVEDGKSSL